MYTYSTRIWIYTIKKESPNEGTETCYGFRRTIALKGTFIKKESPNEGTETMTPHGMINHSLYYKKRIPE